MDEPVASPPARAARNLSARGGWDRFHANRPASVAAAVLAVLIVAVVALPWFLSLGPNDLTEARLAAPSGAHWLGTDASGRDLLARVCFGARISLVVGMAGAGVSLVVGIAWGAMAGYLGGRIDAILMRTVDVLYSLPTIVVVIVLVPVTQSSLKSWLEAGFGVRGGDQASLVVLILGLGAVSWLTMARIVRGQVRSLVNQPFVEAGRALGAGHLRLLAHHILPNTAGVVIVYLTLTIPAVVLGESFLSYLGLGIQPPQASLGSLIADGAGQINPIRTCWWLLAAPGGLLVALLLALNLVGDGLRDAFDPRSAARAG